jgi:hypothetical protein
MASSACGFGASPVLIAVTNPDLQAVVAVSLIGLLLTLNVMSRSPDLGALIAQYNQF